MFPSFVYFLIYPVCHMVEYHQFRLRKELQNTFQLFVVKFSKIIPFILFVEKEENKIKIHLISKAIGWYCQSFVSRFSIFCKHLILQRYRR